MYMYRLPAMYIACQWAIQTLLATNVQVHPNTYTTGSPTFKYLILKSTIIMHAMNRAHFVCFTCFAT